MKYFFSYSEPQKHFIDIKVVVENISADTTGLSSRMEAGQV
jgi:hypothetical protein